jgi:hypothetical protein
LKILAIQHSISVFSVDKIVGGPVDKELARTDEFGYDCKYAILSAKDIDFPGWPGCGNFSFEIGQISL